MLYQNKKFSNVSMVMGMEKYSEIPKYFELLNKDHIKLIEKCNAE